MTDPVEALAAAIESRAWRWLQWIDDAEDGDPRVTEACRNASNGLLTALRASGFDVVPTGEPAGSADAAWEALQDEIANLYHVDQVRRHRPAIEAAIRAESTGTLDVHAAHMAFVNSGDAIDCRHLTTSQHERDVAAEYARLSSSDTGERR